MSLFIGNISKKVTKKQFEDTFRSYGRCRIDLRANNQSSDKQYAFVQFDNDRQAENAKTDLHNTQMCGLKLNIEWSKNSGRFGENGRRGGGAGQDMGRGRRDERERSWGRNRRQRSFSRDKKRDSPDYTQDLQAPPLCKRDIILLQKLHEKEVKQQIKMLNQEIQKKDNQKKDNQKKENQKEMQVQN